MKEKVEISKKSFKSKQMKYGNDNTHKSICEDDDTYRIYRGICDKQVIDV